MKTKAKQIILIITILIIGIVAFFVNGFYTMAIEDQYGDFQKIFYQSKSADIIVNEESKEFGIVEKGWTRLSVWTQEEDLMDLYTFANKVSYYSKIKVFRPKNKIEGIKQMDFIDVQKLIVRKRMKLVLEHKNE